MSPAVHDTITISGISAVGHHGVFDHERRDGQTFVADVTLHVDTRPAAQSDRLDLTVDYGLVSEQVAGVLSGEPADLVETVAERIAAAVLAHPGVLAVDVVVHKPQAPISVPFADVTITIHRDRDHVPSVAGPPVVVEQARGPQVVPPAEPAWGHAAPGFQDAATDGELSHAPSSPVEPDALRTGAPGSVPTWAPTGVGGVGTGLFATGAAPGLVGAGLVGAGLVGPPPGGPVPAAPGPGVVPGSAPSPDAGLPHAGPADGGGLPDDAARPAGAALPDSLTVTDARTAADEIPGFAPEPTAVLPVESDTGRHARLDAALTAAAPAAAPVQAPVPAPGPAPWTPGGEQPTDRMDVAPAEPVEVVLALGSNVGASHDLLRRAVRALADVPGLELTEIAPLARTGPVGGPPQPDFLNTVVLGTTSLSPRAVLHACQRVEDSLGRERVERWGPRTVDIDVIVHGSTVASADDLELPHPRAHERAFVLQPWAQVRPDAVLPGLGGGPVAVLAETAPDRGGIRWMALDWWTAPEGSA